MEEGLRICKRCLTREMAGKEEVFQNLHEYIENLDQDIRAGEDLYEERLQRCKECDMLLQGMCRGLRMLCRAAGSSRT